MPARPALPVASPGQTLNPFASVASLCQQELHSCSVHDYKEWTRLYTLRLSLLIVFFCSARGPAIDPPRTCCNSSFLFSLWWDGKGVYTVPKAFSFRRGAEWRCSRTFTVRCMFIDGRKSWGKAVDRLEHLSWSARWSFCARNSSFLFDVG